MIAEEGVEAKPREDAIEDRQCGDTVRGQGPGGAVGGGTAGDLWIGLFIRSARRFPHGSVPSTHSVGPRVGRGRSPPTWLSERGKGQGRKYRLNSCVDIPRRKS